MSGHFTIPQKEELKSNEKSDNYPSCPLFLCVTLLHFDYYLQIVPQKVGGFSYGTQGETPCITFVKVRVLSQFLLTVNCLVNLREDPESGAVI